MAYRVEIEGTQEELDWLWHMLLRCGYDILATPHWTTQGKPVSVLAKECASIFWPTSMCDFTLRAARHATSITVYDQENGYPRELGKLLHAFLQKFRPDGDDVFEVTYTVAASGDCDATAGCLLVTNKRVRDLFLPEWAAAKRKLLARGFHWDKATILKTERHPRSRKERSNECTYVYADRHAALVAACAFINETIGDVEVPKNRNELRALLRKREWVTCLVRWRELGSAGYHDNEIEIMPERDYDEEAPAVVVGEDEKEDDDEDT